MVLNLVSFIASSECNFLQVIYILIRNVLTVNSYLKYKNIVYARIHLKSIDKMENICNNTIKGERA